MTIHATSKGFIQSNCNKATYTKKQAKTALNAANHRPGNKKHGKLRVYHCPDCNNWHLTGKEKYD